MVLICDSREKSAPINNGCAKLGFDNRQHLEETSVEDNNGRMAEDPCTRCKHDTYGTRFCGFCGLLQRNHASLLVSPAKKSRARPKTNWTCQWKNQSHVQRACTFVWAEGNHLFIDTLSEKQLMAFLQDPKFQANKTRRRLNLETIKGYVTKYNQGFIYPWQSGDVWVRAILRGAKSTMNNPVPPVTHAFQNIAISPTPPTPPTQPTQTFLPRDRFELLRSELDGILSQVNAANLQLALISGANNSAQTAGVERMQTQSILWSVRRRAVGGCDETLSVAISSLQLILKLIQTVPADTFASLFKGLVVQQEATKGSTIEVVHEHTRNKCFVHQLSFRVTHVGDEHASCEVEGHCEKLRQCNIEAILQSLYLTLSKLIFLHLTERRNISVQHRDAQDNLVNVNSTDMFVNFLAEMKKSKSEIMFSFDSNTQRESDTDSDSIDTDEDECIDDKPPHAQWVPHGHPEHANQSTPLVVGTKKHHVEIVKRDPGTTVHGDAYDNYSGEYSGGYSGGGYCGGYAPPPPASMFKQEEKTSVRVGNALVTALRTDARDGVNDDELNRNVLALVKEVEDLENFANRFAHMQHNYIDDVQYGTTATTATTATMDTTDTTGINDAPRSTDTTDTTRTPDTTATSHITVISPSQTSVDKEAYVFVDRPRTHTEVPSTHTEVPSSTWRGYGRRKKNQQIINLQQTT